MFQVLKVRLLISGPSLNPLTTVHSAHTQKNSKNHFSVCGRTTKDNVSAPQGLCICSSVTREPSVKRLLSFVREASFTDTGIPHGQNANPSIFLMICTEGNAVLQNTQMCQAQVEVYTLVNAHKACWNICIKSLHMIICININI